MRTASIICLLLAAFLVSTTCAQQPEKRLTDTEFHSFWEQFRAAVIANDQHQVVSMTKFPFETRGVDDSDPVVRHDQASFLKLYDKMLSQDAGLSVEPETMKHFIERRTAVSGKEVNGKSGSARVANFVFEKVKGQWLFVRAYLEE